MCVLRMVTPPGRRDGFLPSVVDQKELDLGQLIERFVIAAIRPRSS